ncbi:hypothetical protein AHX12_21545 [Salmonella enterica subsp. enterica]|nr:hypothetical protein [Salmonella enterica subsp. enterica serovar Livingstone]
MPHYATSFPIAWRLRGLNATLRDQHSSMAWRLRGLNATLRDQPPHGLAIKGVKCHATRSAFLHGLAIKGVKCHATRPTSPWAGD